MILRRPIDVASGLAARTVLRVVAAANGGRPLSVDRVEAVSGIGTGPDSLIGLWRREVPGRRLKHPRLAEELGDQILGTWALGLKTIEYLQGEIGRRRPDLIFEFGSGISTLCLTRFMADLHGLGGLRVVSIEQNEDFARATQSRLERSGLGSMAAIFVAPLKEQQIAGLTTTCYAIPPEVGEVLGSRRAALVVIDGPAAEEGARFGTLPLVRPFAGPDARFVMDDALRDGELAIARRWRALSYVDIDGVLPFEKGLLVGSIYGDKPSAVR